MTKKILTVDYLKSALSINTTLGCSLNCKYCIVSEISEKVPKRISTPEKVVTELLSHKFFIKDLTPIVINNKTDPLLPSVKKDTFKILRLLQEKNIRNPRMIISKLELLPEDLIFLEEINEPVFFIVSYSNLENPIELGNFKSQKRTLNVLKQRKRVKSLHYWRPLIRGLNDSEESILEVLNNVKEACDGSIISGIRITKNVENCMKKYGAIFSDWEGDVNHKHLPKDIQEKIIQIKNKYFKNYPIYRHTSCGINATLNRLDWGFNFLKDCSHCMINCKNKMNCILNKPDVEDVKEKMLKIDLNEGFNINDDCIYIEGEITQDERAFLLHSLKFPIKAKKINKSFSEKMILGENDE